MVADPTGVLQMPETIARPFKIGDRVRFLHSPTLRGRVVEFRGPLGPGGAEVYSVLLRRRPSRAYIEVLGEQIEVIPATATPAT